jgi:hypothetical protein
MSELETKQVQPITTTETGLPVKPSLPVQTIGINRDGCIYGYGPSPSEPKFTLAIDTGLVFFGKPILSLTHHVTKGRKQPYLNVYLNTFAFDDDGNQLNGVFAPAKNGLTVLKMKIGGLPNEDTGKMLVQNAPASFCGDLRTKQWTSHIDQSDFNGIIYTSKGSKGGIFANIYSMSNEPLDGVPLNRDPDRFQCELNHICQAMGQNTLFPLAIDAT